MLSKISTVESKSIVESNLPLQRLSYADIVRGTLPRFITSSNSPVLTPSLSSSLYPVSSALFQFPSDYVLFSNEFFQVRKTKQKGYSAFAIRDIEEGTTILAETPLMKAEIMTVYYEYERLTKQQQMEYRSLAGWEVLGPGPMAIFKTNR